MQNKETVSVILPVYNAEKYLDETIQSVLCQTYCDFELIIINHACTDNSADIIKQYIKSDERVVSIELDINKGGPAYPRNEGIKKAHGEYIAFIDSDDVWLPNKIEEQLSFMKENKLNFSSSNILVIDENSEPLKMLSMMYKVKLFYRSFFNLQKDFVMNNFIVLASVMVSRHVIEFFNEDPNYIAAEDYDLWLRLLGKKDVSFGLSRKPLIKYRFMSNSLSKIGNQQQQVRALHSTVDYILLEKKIELYDVIRRTLAKKMVFSWFLNIMNKLR